MLRGMTRTIELDEALLEQVEALARREETTPAAIVERAIRHVLGEPTKTAKYGDWRDHIVDGEGLQPPFTEDDWGAIREASYERGPVE